MKHILSILSLIMFTQLANTQDSWTVKLNNKVLLTSSKEDTVANTKTIKNLEWRKSGYLEISFKEYTESEPSVLNHSFLFCDENDNQLLVKENVTHTKVAVTTLRKLFAGKKKIILYTMASPKNPMMAIRSRRIHLCTLLLP